MAQALASGTAFATGGPNAAGENAGARPVPSPEEIAAKFPQFEILGCLGRGGMGVVYKARQKSLNRVVAIKVLAPEREHDARFAERFAREAELLAKLSHPHIVTIHDFGRADGLFYIVMEFVDGVNLRDLLREAKIEPKQALAIVPPVCEALQYAHDHGVVHRDIKPENLLLDREGRVKIADFGIAALVGGDGAGERAGTPPYMAPEQGGGKSGASATAIDHRADIYALGVVLYEMLTGERPGREVVAPSRKVQIDVRLDEIVLRALEKQPELRYATATEFKTRVETVVAEGERKRGRAETQIPRWSGGRRDYLAALAWVAPVMVAWWFCAVFCMPKVNEIAEQARLAGEAGGVWSLLKMVVTIFGGEMLRGGALLLLFVLLAELFLPAWRRRRRVFLRCLAVATNVLILCGLVGLIVSVLVLAPRSVSRERTEAVSAPFREYEVRKTFAELAGESAEPRAPEGVAGAALVDFIEKDAATAKRVHELDSPLFPAGAIKVDLSASEKAAARGQQILRALVYRDDLAAVIYRRADELASSPRKNIAAIVLGRRDGRWGIFFGASDALSDDASEDAVETSFRAKAPELFEALKRLPAQRPSAGSVGAMAAVSVTAGFVGSGVTFQVESGPKKADPSRSISVTVSGAVARSGAHALREGATLLDALAAAGGWTSPTPPTRVSISSRAAKETRTPARVHDLEAILAGRAPNPSLRPEDSVEIEQPHF